MRMEGIDPARASGELAAFFARQQEDFGMALPSSRLMARRPSILFGLQAFRQGIAESGLLPASLIALINRRVAWHNGCPF